MKAQTVDVIAVVSAKERSTEAVLAAEALKRAARDQQVSLAVEVRTALGTLGLLDDAQSARALLLVGSGDFKVERFGALPRHETSIENVLSDVRGELARAASSRRLAAATAKRIVAITSCPTGIAHTFMAAEGIQQAARALGHTVRIETQGSVGAHDTLSSDEIAAADLVLIAADTQVDLTRFAGKPLFRSGTKAAINDGRALLGTAFSQAKPYTSSNTGAPASAEHSPQHSPSGPYKHLMTGLSYMLPFAAAGGMLVALAFALGGIYVFDDAHTGTFSGWLFQVGTEASSILMVPALAGYLAFSIADRPGITPGMIGGLVASKMGAGFLGGIAAGYLAGYSVAALNRGVRLPPQLEGLKPVMILPVLGTLLTGLLLIYVVGSPVAQLMTLMTSSLRSLQSGWAIVLGLIIGGVSVLDMGGPISKAFYAFAVGLLASQVYSPMAAMMAAGITPPLGIALAAQLFRDRFTKEERQARMATCLFGLAFVTEGAIPYATRDPLNVKPALMLGSATAGAISMAVGVELKVPHGGVFVLPIPNVVTHLGGYVLAIIAGTLVTAFALRLFKTRFSVQQHIS